MPCYASTTSGGNRDKLPDIAIVDWGRRADDDRVPSLRRLLCALWHHRHHLRSQRHGVPVTARSTPAGAPWTTSTARVLTTELIQRFGIEHPIVDAPRAGAICMANPLPASWCTRRRAAVASDERNAYLFTPEEQEAIHQHIPWTRVLEERKTVSPDGADIDLVPWASANKEELVLEAKRRIRRQGRPDRLGNGAGRVGCCPLRRAQRPRHRPGARHHRL